MPVRRLHHPQVPAAASIPNGVDAHNRRRRLHGRHASALRGHRILQTQRTHGVTLHEQEHCLSMATPPGAKRPRCGSKRIEQGAPLRASERTTYRGVQRTHISAFCIPHFVCRCMICASRLRSLASDTCSSSGQFRRLGVQVEPRTKKSGPAHDVHMFVARTAIYRALCTGLRGRMVLSRTPLRPEMAYTMHCFIFVFLVVLFDCGLCSPLLLLHPPPAPSRSPQAMREVLYVHKTDRFPLRSVTTPEHPFDRLNGGAERIDVVTRVPARRKTTTKPSSHQEREKKKKQNKKPAYSMGWNPSRVSEYPQPRRPSWSRWTLANSSLSGSTSSSGSRWRSSKTTL